MALKVQISLPVIKELWEQYAVHTADNEKALLKLYEVNNFDKENENALGDIYGRFQI